MPGNEFFAQGSVNNPSSGLRAGGSIPVSHNTTFHFGGGTSVPVHQNVGVPTRSAPTNSAVENQVGAGVTFRF